MNIRRVVIALSLVAVVGCEQVSQELPMGPELGEAVSRTVGPEGGVVSTPAGLSLRFEAGSLSRPTEVTVMHRSGADMGAAVEGHVVAGTVFDIGPSGSMMAVPAVLSLRVPEATLEGADPMALTAVLVSGAEQYYLSDASVDLSAGVLKTALPRLGTVGLRVSGDVIEVGAAGAATRGGATGARSSIVGVTGSAAVTHRTSELSMACGGDGEPTCSSTDAITLTLTDDLYDAFHGCVEFIDPEISVQLTLEETSGGPATGEASGTVTFSGTLRYQTGSDGSACGDGGGSVQSIVLDETFTVGADEATPFTYDPAAGTITFDRTSEGTETLDCDCGADIFAASEIRIGQTSEEITFEGLTGQVTWAIELSR